MPPMNVPTNHRNPARTSRRPAGCLGRTVAATRPHAIITQPTPRSAIGMYAGWVHESAMYSTTRPSTTAATTIATTW